MKKIAPLFVFATLALAATSPAQAPTPSSAQAGDVHSADLLSAHRPNSQSSATPAPNNGGKKMVGDVMLATDEKGKSVTASFPAGTTMVYLVTKNVSGAKGDKVMAEWYADDAGKALPKGKRFYNSDIELPNTSSYNPSFHVTGPGNKALPPGKYHVDVSVGGEKLKSAKFSVQ